MQKYGFYKKPQKKLKIVKKGIDKPIGMWYNITTKKVEFPALTCTQGRLRVDNRILCGIFIPCVLCGEILFFRTFFVGRTETEVFWYQH